MFPPMPVSEVYVEAFAEHVVEQLPALIKDPSWRSNVANACVLATDVINDDKSDDKRSEALSGLLAFWHDVVPGHVAARNQSEDAPPPDNSANRVEAMRRALEAGGADVSSDKLVAVEEAAAEFFQPIDLDAATDLIVAMQTGCMDLESVSLSTLTGECLFDTMGLVVALAPLRALPIWGCAQRAGSKSAAPHRLPAAALLLQACVRPAMRDLKDEAQAAAELAAATLKQQLACVLLNVASVEVLMVRGVGCRSLETGFPTNQMGLKLGVLAGVVETAAALHGAFPPWLDFHAHIALSRQVQRRQCRWNPEDLQGLCQVAQEKVDSMLRGGGLGEGAMAAVQVMVLAGKIEGAMGAKKMAEGWLRAEREAAEDTEFQLREEIEEQKKRGDAFSSALFRVCGVVKNLLCPARMIGDGAVEAAAAGAGGPGGHQLLLMDGAGAAAPVVAAVDNAHVVHLIGDAEGAVVVGALGPLVELPPPGAVPEDEQGQHDLIANADEEAQHLPDVIMLQPVDGGGEAGQHAGAAGRRPSACVGAAPCGKRWPACSTQPFGSRPAAPNHAAAGLQHSTMRQPACSSNSRRRWAW